MNTKRAVVLLSGGVDSSTTLAIARADGHDCFALTIDYGQRHRRELKAAQEVAAHLMAKRHLVLTVELAKIGGSALTAPLEVPKGRTEREMSAEVPVTYVPARNLIFLSLATAWAESLEAGCVYIGVNAVDFSGYPDCRPDFIKAFQHAADIGTKAGVSGRPISIAAPLSGLTKAEIIRLGSRLGIDWGMTFSCYDPAPNGLACGQCDSCLIRRRGFLEAGMRDSSLTAYDS